jgi:hypothetical protein
MLKDASRMDALPSSSDISVLDALRWANLSSIKTKRVTDGLPVYGHRFGGEYGPESSGAALEKSLAKGVDGLECDIILSGDDEVFALHDPDLALCTGLTGWARDRTAGELDEACIRGQNGEISDQHPLRLRAVLDLIPTDLRCSSTSRRMPTRTWSIGPQRARVRSRRATAPTTGSS